MISHDFKLTFRQLTKNKTHSFIGIASFAFGFSICLVIALFIQHELTMIPVLKIINAFIDWAMMKATAST